MKKLLFSLALFLLLPLHASASSSDCEHPFYDISRHWAEDEICFLYEQNVVDGVSHRNFAPNQNITRAEFLKISLLNLGYVVSARSSYDNYYDVSSGDWHYRYVTYATSRGFVEGYDDGSFRPNDSITRAEAMVLTMRMAGLSSYYPNDFNRYGDVSEDDWFADAVYSATEMGIVSGYSNGEFRPHQALTRAEAAVIANRTYDRLYKFSTVTTQRLDKSKEIRYNTWINQKQNAQKTKANALPKLEQPRIYSPSRCTRPACRPRVQPIRNR